MKILIVRVSAIGDVVHTLPAIFLLKKCCPQAQISWVVQKKAAHIIKDQPFIENVFFLNDKFLHPKNIVQTLKTIKELRKTKWDAIIDFQGIHKTSILLACLSEHKFGFARPHTRSGISTWFTHTQVIPEYKNVIQKNLSLASQVATQIYNATSCPTIDELKKSFNYAFEAQSKKEVDAWLSNNNIKNFVLMCPNTTWESKHWPEENWFEFAKLFESCKSGHNLLLAGYNFGNAAKKIAQMLQKQNIQINLVPNWNLNTTAYLISKAGLVIAPDTGLLHLADFLNVKTIGIFGPTSKELLGPFLNSDNIKNAIQVYRPDKWNLKKTTKPDNKMYKLDTRMLLNKVRSLLNEKNNT